MRCLALVLLMCPTALAGPQATKSLRTRAGPKATAEIAAPQAPQPLRTRAGPKAKVAGPFVPPSEDAVGAAQSASRAMPLAERLVRVSQPFVGAPYRVSPLGEGTGEDKDPRFRTDAFDCTTFVETTIALALTDELTRAKAELDAIRYRDAVPNFLARRHFPEAEWIPELIALGYLEEITRAVAGDETARADKVLNKAVWRRRKRPSHLELPDERIPDGTFSVDIWPLDKARAGQKKIPAGTVLNLVRVDYRSVPVRVTHQGLVIERRGKQYLRHAADRMYHGVVDEPLDRFFSRMQKYKKWPVAGVSLQAVRDPHSAQ